MDALRRVAALGAMVAVLALATGTGGFTAVHGDRIVQVDIAEDPDARLGILVDCDDGVTTLTLINRYDVDLDYTVDGHSGTLAAGDSTDVALPGVYAGDDVDVEASGEDVELAKTKHIGADGCEPTPTATPTPAPGGSTESG